MYRKRGRYTLKFIATAKDKSTKEYTASFTVLEREKTVITFSGMTAPSSFMQGSNYDLKGTVSLNVGTLKTIKCQVLNAKTGKSG